MSGAAAAAGAALAAGAACCANAAPAPINIVTATNKLACILITGSLSGLSVERILPGLFLGKVLQRLLDQPRRPRVRIARAVPFHRKISFVIVLFRDPKRLRQIHLRALSLLAYFRFLHVRNTVRVAKHPLDSLVRILVVMRRH